jgi:hypothetical protein
MKGSLTGIVVVECEKNVLNNARIMNNARRVDDLGKPFSRVTSTYATLQLPLEVLAIPTTKIHDSDYRKLGHYRY